VRGKTQTHLPWESWENPNLAGLKEKWFHDIFDVGGVAHDPEEVELLRLLSAIDARTPHWPLVEIACEPAGATLPEETQRDAQAA
jgi:hypothetical protein